MQKVIPVLLLIFITFSGCQLFDTDGNISPDDVKANLVDKTWELQTVLKDGYGIYAPERDSMYVFQFNADGKLSGHDICNSCGGDYSINKDGELVFNDIFCTEIACQGFQHSIPFSTAFSAESHKVTFEDNKLQITVPDNSTERIYQFAEYGSTKEAIMAETEPSFNFTEWPNEGYHYLSTSLSDDLLSVDISYSGCGPHELNLVFYSYFKESSPPIAHAFIAHTNESCDAVFRATETFSLEPLKKAYQELYSPGSSIKIIIGDNGPDPDTLLYTF